MHVIEESFKLKRKLLLSVLAMVSAALMPLAATGQVAPPRGSRSADSGTPTYKYSVYAGLGYTSLNQVNLSRSGLFGAEVYATRNFGRYFGVVAEGDYYKYPYAHPVVENSTITPSVASVLFGPELHAVLYGRYGGFIHGLIGGEHTGGESQQPNISFSGGVGGGAEYTLTPRLSVRASGDYIGQSFTVAQPAAGDSAHRTWNPRASIGVMYRF
jgi:opacity protein-like surface antigen